MADRVPALRVDPSAVSMSKQVGTEHLVNDYLTYIHDLLSNRGNPGGQTPEQLLVLQVRGPRLRRRRRHNHC